MPLFVDLWPQPLRIIYRQRPLSHWLLGYAHSSQAARALSHVDEPPGRGFQPLAAPSRRRAPLGGAPVPRQAAPAAPRGLPGARCASGGKGLPAASRPDSAPDAVHHVRREKLPACCWSRLQNIENGYPCGPRAWPIGCKKAQEFLEIAAVRYNPHSPISCFRRAWGYGVAGVSPPAAPAVSIVMLQTVVYQKLAASSSTPGKEAGLFT